MKVLVAVVASVAVASGLVVLLALLPYSGIDTAPPECYSVAGYVVPCASSFAVTGAAVAAALVVVGAVIGRQLGPG